MDFGPCIGAGIDSMQIGGIWYYVPSADIEGHSRPDPPGSRPDLGAYEGLGPEEVSMDVNTIPDKFRLYQNYPNPFNPTTKVSFVISHWSFVSLKVYDILGREVATLVSEKRNPGKYDVIFDGSSASGGLPSGVYFYRLQTEHYTNTKKFILLK
jgi:hypothetical protein